MMKNTGRLVRIGLLGAAFDPPHFGHLRLAQLALNSHEIDEIWLVPSPERWDKKPVASAEHRVAWLKAAVNLSPHELRSRLQVTDIELQQPTYRGTYQLILQLSQLYLDKSFTLVLGWDSFVGIPAWRDPTTGELNGDKLLKSTRCLVSPRANSQTIEHSPHPAPHNGGVVMLPALDDPEAGDIDWMVGVNALQVAALSSSLIRTAIATNTPLEFLFPEIEKQIRDGGDYEKNKK